MSTMYHSQVVSAVFVGCVMCLAACTPPSSPPAPQAEPKADALAAKVAGLEERLETVSKIANRADIGVSSLKSRHQEAEIDPSDPKFQRIDIDVGSFALSVADVTPFGDGVKVKMKLGNLTSASVSDVTLHLTYGPRLGESDDFTAWSEKLKSKDAAILTTLLPGSWNPVSVVLPGIEPKNFGYISISMDATTIALRKN